MKKRFLSLLFLPLLLVGCGSNTVTSSIDEGSYDTHTVDHARKTGEIADFDLLGPNNGFTTDTGCTFTWQASENADYYALEIASTLTFVSDDEDEVYVRESNISLNKFDLEYSLPKKDITYYWRVTAVNKTNTKKCNDVRTFFYASAKVDEIPIEIEDA